MANPQPVPSSTLLHALAHPVRLRMLSRLWEGPHSAADLARLGGISHGLASQHLKVLREADLVVPAGTEIRRGGQARLYTASGGTPLSSLASSGADVGPLVATMAALMTERAGRAQAGSQALAADAELRVSHDAWRAFRDHVLSAVTELHRQARPDDSPDTVLIALTVLGLPLRADED